MKRFALVLLSMLIICIPSMLYSCAPSYKSTSVFAMDTVIDFYTLDASKQALDGAKDMIQSYESIFSRTSPDSALSVLNGSTENVPDKELYGLIEYSLGICKNTGGALDITSASLADLWNVTSSNPRVPEKTEIDMARALTGWEKISAENGVIKKPLGITLDLGAVAKGYVAERVVKYLRDSGVTSGYVSFGGGISVVGEKTNGDGWKIGIKDPRADGEITGYVIMKDGYMSTSGDYERYFEYEGVRYHHIFDTSTGYPANSGIISAVVISDSGALSDALSTACFVMGKEKTLQLYKSGVYDFEAILMLSDGTVTVTAGAGFVLTGENWRLK